MEIREYIDAARERVELDGRMDDDVRAFVIDRLDHALRLCPPSPVAVVNSTQPLTAEDFEDGPDSAAEQLERGPR